jgi:hypothetical protein
MLSMALLLVIGAITKWFLSVKPFLLYGVNNIFSIIINLRLFEFFDKLWPGMSRVARNSLQRQGVSAGDPVL